MEQQKLTVGSHNIRIVKEISKGSYGWVFMVHNVANEHELWALKITIA